MKYKEVSFEEMMSQLKAHGEDDVINAKVVFKKGVFLDPYNGDVPTRTFLFDSGAKMFNDKIGFSCFATNEAFKDDWMLGVERIEYVLEEKNVALCYIEDKEEA